MEVTAAHSEVCRALFGRLAAALLGDSGDCSGREPLALLELDYSAAGCGPARDVVKLMKAFACDAIEVFCWRRFGG